jgi:hypothetical protein
VKNLFFTDYHDIEMTMLGFEKVRLNVLTEYRLQDMGNDIWNNVLNESSLIAYIRWYNENNVCKIKFEGLKLANFVTKTDREVYLKQEDYICVLNKRSSNRIEDLTLDNIENFKTMKQTPDLLNLCNGHDSVELIALILGCSDDVVCKGIRWSFTLQEFSKTKLYSDINRWQQERGFTFLKKVA